MWISYVKDSMKFTSSKCRVFFGGFIFFYLYFFPQMVARPSLSRKHHFDFFRLFFFIVVIVAAISTLVLFAYYKAQSSQPDGRYHVVLQSDSLDDLRPQPTRKFPELKDVKREIILTQAARDLGIPSNQRSKFVAMCSILTPINFCAESARLAQMRVCWTEGCALQNGIRPGRTMTKDDVQSVVRRGLGLHPLQLHNATAELLVENDMTYSPRSFSLSTISHANSQTPRDKTGSLKARMGSPLPGYPRPTNTKENTELETPFSPETFFEGRRSQRTTISPDDRKIILWYSPTRYWPNSPGLLPLRGCPHFPCLVTREKKYAKRSAAMIFAGMELPLCVMVLISNFSLKIRYTRMFNTIIT